MIDFMICYSIKKVTVFASINIYGWCNKFLYPAASNNILNLEKCVFYIISWCRVRIVKIHFLFEINYVNEFGLYTSITMGGFGNVRVGSNETQNFGIRVHFDWRQPQISSGRSSHDYPLRWRALERNGWMVHNSPHRIRTVQRMHIKHNKFVVGWESCIIILERHGNITTAIDNRRYDNRL